MEPETFGAEPPSKKHGSTNLLRVSGPVHAGVDGQSAALGTSGRAQWAGVRRWRRGGRQARLLGAGGAMGRGGSGP